MAPDHASDQALPDDETVARVPIAPVRPTGPDLDDTIVTVSPRPLPGPAVPPPASPISGPAAASPHPAPIAADPRTRNRHDTPTRAGVRRATDGAVAEEHSVRMPDGAVVGVEGGTVYVGRRPSLPRVPAAGTPRLVEVASPGREVSATHLAISAVGGTIVVRDMLSTNGTVVATPGAPARTLLRGESAVVTPGTVLDLGDGNRIEVLS